MATKSDKRYFRAAGIWSLGVWVLLLVPGPAASESLDTFLPAWLVAHGDKVVHFALALPLGYLLRRGWHSRSNAFAWCLLVLFGFGCLTEGTQGLVPYRSAEMTDLLADLVGGVVGVLIARRSLVSSPRFGQEENLPPPDSPREVS